MAPENPFPPDTRPHEHARWENDNAHQERLAEDDNRLDFESARRADAGLHPQTDNPVGLAPQQVSTQTGDSTGNRAQPVRASILSEGSDLSPAEQFRRELAGQDPDTQEVHTGPVDPDQLGAGSGLQTSPETGTVTTQAAAPNPSFPPGPPSPNFPSSDGLSSDQQVRDVDVTQEEAQASGPTSKPGFAFPTQSEPVRVADTPAAPTPGSPYEPGGLPTETDSDLSHGQQVDQVENVTSTEPPLETTAPGDDDNAAG